MVRYVVAGMENTTQAHGNFIEPGVEIERLALIEKRKHYDEDRPAGKPFVIEAPKNYPKK
jgi:hypothetical protein